MTVYKVFVNILVSEYISMLSVTLKLIVTYDSKQVTSEKDFRETLTSFISTYDVNVHVNHLDLDAGKSFDEAGTVRWKEGKSLYGIPPLSNSTENVENIPSIYDAVVTCECENREEIDMLVQIWREDFKQFLCIRNVFCSAEAAEVIVID